jgi:HAE1 family hydrophobic/amphiphilic exporter-1
MWFTRVSIKNPVFAVMIVLGLVVLGFIGYGKMAVDQFPDVEIPVIVVQTTYAGASPSSVENDVSRPMEEALNTVGGIKTLTSRSYQGISVVVAQFDMGTNMNNALQDVRAKIDRARRNLPDDAEDPIVSQNDPNSAPILSLVVAGSPQRTLRELTDFAENTIKPRLQTARGVGEVGIYGGVNPQINVILDAAKMQSLGVGINEIATAIENANQELPAGVIKNSEKELTVQVKGRLKSVTDFNGLIIATRGNQPVYLDQVARVEDGIAEKNSVAMTDGQTTLSISIIKSSGTNTLEVAQNVRDQITQLEKSLPADIKISTRQDQTLSIRSSVNEVRNTIFEGAILAIFIVFLFLHSWRSTVITALTLPVSIIGTFGFMYLLGYTINNLTLMALSLSVGLLIDDAIVVRENIVRHMQMGKDHYTASLEGTQEIGLAVLATTLSIVAVFLPIAYMGGTIGQFFHQFGITVVVAVLLSMFVSFTLDPMLSSKWHDPDAEKPLAQKKGARVLVWFEKQIEAFSNTYQNLLKRALKHRIMTLAIAVSTFVVSLFVAQLIGSEFVPQGDYSEMNIKFKTPVGTSLVQSTEKTRQVQLALKDNFPEVDYSFARVGGGTNDNNVVNLYVKLKPVAQRSRKVNDLLGPVRQTLSTVAGIRISKVAGQESGPSGANKRLVYNIQGADLKRLEAYSVEVMAALKPIGGVADLESSVVEKKPTIDIVMDHQRAADLGVNSSAISSVLAGTITGYKAGTWRAPNDQDYDIQLRLPAEQRARPEDVADMRITTGINPQTGEPILVRVGDVAQITHGESSSEIVRENLMRQIRIDANPVGRSPGDVSADVEAALKKINWEPGYYYAVAGDAQDSADSAKYAAAALGLAVIFIYMVLASQFNSFLQPVAIMSTLPLSLIGVFLALLLFKSTLNIFSIVGFILLMGLVTKNAILLIDFVNQARASGSTRTEAIIEAAHIRLRPILMTTLAMIFGMLPLALALGEGAEQRAPMGQAVIGGTITSTLLTLVVVPVVYTYLDDGAVKLRHWWAERQRKRQEHN